jgi:ABC-2 type transport system permease protein
MSAQWFPAAEEPAPTPLSKTRPLYWSVRRELWENRSLYLAPLIVAAVALFGSFVQSAVGLTKKMRMLPTLDAAKQHSLLVTPYHTMAAVIMLTTFLVGLFYSLDALYGERRERSLLFWKSLPVSDRITVLSKASIPLVILPSIGFLLTQVTIVILLFLSTAMLLGHGMSPAPLWSALQPIQQPLIMAYGLSVHVLWFAPIYAWLLLISAWARRTPLLWAVLPPFAIAMVEKIVFGTSYFPALLKYRVIGAMTEAFSRGEGLHTIRDDVSQLDPVRFIGSPGLWIGLTFAAAFLAAAVRLRRNREPL